MRSGDADVNEDETGVPAVAQRRGLMSPGLGILLIGGVSLGGIVCMCLGVLMLALWKGI